MKRITLPTGEDAAIYNVENEIFATADLCTHGKSSLTDEGYLEGFIVECGRHGGAFDVRTGGVVRAPCEIALKSIPTVVRDGQIWVAF